MKIRRLVSLTTLVAFFFLALTGIALFLSPQGRVAQWSGWTLLGLSREEYTSVHTTFMVLFLVVGVWHGLLNWRPIVSYLRDRSRRVSVFTPESSVALALGAAFLVGTLAGWFPFQQVLDAGNSIKERWEATEGTPPWGHAELATLERFCRGMEDVERLEHQRLVTIDCDEAMASLRASGIEVEDRSQQLIDIARLNGTTPQSLAEIVASVARPREAGAAGPEEVAKPEAFPLPASGLGRMTLRQYADRYAVDLEEALARLRGRGADLDPDERLRDEASRLGTDPEGLLLRLSGEAAD